MGSRRTRPSGRRASLTWIGRTVTVNGLSVAEIHERVRTIDFRVPVDIVYGAPDHWDHVHIEIDG